MLPNAHPKPTPVDPEEKRRAQIERDRRWRQGAAKKYAQEAERKPVNPVNRDRRRRLSEEAFGEYADKIRACFCVVPGCPEPSEAAHFKSRGAGGKARHLFPCCSAHHREQHDLGIETWQRKYGLDLAAVTAHLWRTMGDGS